jgi:hypothetical protein
VAPKRSISHFETHVQAFPSACRFPSTSSEHYVAASKKEKSTSNPVCLGEFFLILAKSAPAAAISGISHETAARDIFSIPQ